MIQLIDIKRIDAFRNLSEETVSKIQAVADEISLKKGETLFWEKDQVDSVYALVEGKAALLRYSGSGQKRIFFILSEGALINEIVFDNLPVSVVCEAFEKLRLIRISKLEFLEIMKSDFELTYNIMCSMGKKQRRLYRQLKNTVPIKIDKKLAAKLWKLAKDYGVKKSENAHTAKDDSWTLIDLKVSVTELSYLMGSSRETISRALGTLIDLGMVRWEDKRLYVKEDAILEYYRSE